MQGDLMIGTSNISTDMHIMLILIRIDWGGCIVPSVN